MSDFNSEEKRPPEPERCRKDTCPAVGYQKAEVSVPVTIRPFTNVGDAITKCCGDAVIIPEHHPCMGEKNGVCMFTIHQTICVEVPIEFGAVTTVGDTYIDCLGSATNNVCTFCNEHLDE